MNGFSQKYKRLLEHLGNYTADGLVVAFSGGVDSGFLVWASEEARKEFGGRVLALTTDSESMPAHDRADVETFVKQIGVKHVWRNSTEVDQAEYMANDALRCYYCKTELFKIAKDVAAEHDCLRIAYGYSASDRTDTRPGHRAALENDILFPLADYEFTKPEIRQIMLENGFELHDKPSSPCLSSRIMRGVRITKEELKNVDDLETILREGGLRVFRLRVHEIGDKHFLRLETAPEEMAVALRLKDELTRAAKARGYEWITLDLEGYRSGGGTI
ncbi:MAG TPA: TIGR00268 family protein [Candidatus Kryptonia bacterium]